MNVKSALQGASFVFVLCAPAALADMPSAAAQPSPAQKLLNDPSHQQLVAQTAVDIFKKMQNCNDGEAQPTKQPLGVPALGPLQFDPNGALTSGGIKESFVVSGCGKFRVENIVTLAVKGEVKSVPVIPGNTMADPILARDSMPYIQMSIAPKIGQCRDVRVIDTNFDAFEGGPNPRAKFQSNGGRAWRERWTVNACGNEINTDIHFVPDETGTAIQTGIEGKKPAG